MLSFIEIKDFMLIETAHIELDSSFIAITGESGSGKSSLLHAIKAALGYKTSSDCIRKGASSSSVSLTFDCSYWSQEVQNEIKNYLLDLDIPSEPTLILRRSIKDNGTSRAFINEQSTNLKTLFQIGAKLVEVLDQAAGFDLKNARTHRVFLDTGAQLLQKVKDFTSLWKEQQELLRELERLESLKNSGAEKSELYRFQLEEISQNFLLEEEENQLFAQYQHLSSAKASLHCLQACDQIFESIQPSLDRLAQLSQKLCTEKNTQDIGELLEQNIESLRETQWSIRGSYEEDFNEELLCELEAKICAMDKLKKKYGPSHEDIQSFFDSRQAMLDELETLDESIETRKQRSCELKQELESKAQFISQARQKYAVELQDKIAKELEDLHLKGTRIQVKMTPKAISADGKDEVEFWFQPNFGENPLSIHNHASGGELARFFLALKLCHCQENPPPVMILDEVDASLGGISAKMMQKKLHFLSQRQQILCITHFAQVARGAQQHLSIYKSQKKGRTCSNVENLNKESLREKELERMLGYCHDSDKKKLEVHR